MKTRWIVLLTLILILTLSACDAAQSTQETEQPGEQNIFEQSQEPSQAEVPVDSAYPGPVADTASGDAYPDPLYPDIQDGTEVNWDQAQAMIINGEVRMVQLQSSTLQVTLGLKDGRLMYVVITNPDQLHSAIAQCGDLCRSLAFSQD